MESAGIEPAFLRCERSVFPLDDDPFRSGRWGLNPRPLAPKASALPLSYTPSTPTVGIEPTSSGFQPNAFTSAAKSADRRLVGESNPSRP
jgi:hypothetical protein